MTNRLAGKVALITGAARGQGAAEARLFAAEGASVVVTDVRDDALGTLEKELLDSGATVLATRLDVTAEADWGRVVAETTDAFGQLNVLVNNAGILNMAGVEETSLELWNRIVSVNQTGVWLGMKYTIPAMRKTSGGSIVNVSSIYGLIGSGAAAAYQATKGAVRLLTKTAAVQYAPEGIRVNSLHPGVIDTGMVEEEVPADLMPALTAATPLGRRGKPEEIAYGALFLASDESSFATGSELVLDGGYTAQ
ncbi:cyclopentanol dehydrogenase [Mycobacterium gordonae]|jgi:NAD(P)-dependent dehydrogenase (short-subunit alcohol dehydrogenase family)|uniref:Cyclopentanol dehydrogenase n=1 Tax=Mycobacterium gordonae TaxID=1778 RepID=A0A1A6BLV1_MYCGO|nr:glucose 1-dehydrogenase [Mycobacterium gordonae]MBI2702473.1 glucose 1-dehydrogenase [Mycobacterium sp.]OBS03271.1 cyclopentanol dehydrogenase [Mycobacterium gordonae]